MFKANTRSLPMNIQNMFTVIENEGRRKGHFRHQFARLTFKQMSTSIVGIKLWNSLYNQLKECKNIHQIKKVFKARTMKLYEEMRENV